MSKRKVFLVTSNDPWEIVALGFAGENLARTVEWDIGPWMETYGEGEVQLLAKRPVDKDPYPVVVTRDGDSVIWTVRKEDLWDGTAYGMAQLLYLMDGEVVARSKEFLTKTREAIEGDVQECSEPERDWVEQVLQSVAAAEESAGIAEISAESAVKSAEAASISEEITGMYAEEAKEIIAGAEKAMEEFVATAVEKATIASESAVKAQKAVSTVSMAAGDAQTAQEKAEEAQVAAENARIATEAAKTAAETAASEAQENIKDQKKLSGAYTIDRIESGEVIAINNSAACKLQRLKLYGKSKQSETPTLENPVEIQSVGDNKAINVTFHGLNLIYTASVASRNGVVMTANKDGTFTLDGTVINDNAGLYFIGKYGSDKIIHNNTKYIYKVDGLINGDNIIIRDEIQNEYRRSYNHALIYNGSIAQAGIVLKVGHIYNNTIIKPILVAGENIPNEFIAGIEPQIPNYPVPYDLLGLPVSSSGSYTDAVGQQWICDEVDFGRGKHIQRIGKIDHYTNEDVGDVYMSTTGQLSDGATVIYPLETPIETDLPEEVMDAYHQLTMYYPNTTITTDSYPPAGISVEYIADTKTYIDQKYNDLQKQLDILIGSET